MCYWHARQKPSMGRAAVCTTAGFGLVPVECLAAQQPHTTLLQVCHQLTSSQELQHGKAAVSAP
jgi:hypothetical protein